MPSIWLYAIHSNDLELIQILEKSGIQPEDSSYKQCFEESVKCHHNNIANYINDHYLHNYDISYFIKYYNFLLIQNFSIDESLFYAFCENDYYTLVKILLNEKEIDVNKLIILIIMLFIQLNILEFLCHFIENCE